MKNQRHRWGRKGARGRRNKEEEDEEVEEEKKGLTATPYSRICSYLGRVAEGVCQSRTQVLQTSAEVSFASSPSRPPVSHPSLDLCPSPSLQTPRSAPFPPLCPLAALLCHAQRCDRGGARLARAHWCLPFVLDHHHLDYPSEAQAAPCSASFSSLYRIPEHRLDLLHLRLHLRRRLLDRLRLVLSLVPCGLLQHRREPGAG